MLQDILCVLSTMHFNLEFAEWLSFSNYCPLPFELLSAGFALDTIVN